MGGLEDLLAVQEHDTAADQLHHRRGNLPERAALVEREAALVDLDRRLAETGAKRDELTRSQKRLEDELAMVETKAAEVDKRLYSGTVTAPRELQAMQDEIASLKRRQSHLEDQDLEIMVEAEPVDAELEQLRTERAAVDADVTRLQREVEEAEADIVSRLREEEAARVAAAAAVPADLLAHYDDLRRRYKGVVAARLVGATCGSCRLTLPATEVDRIKKLPADELVHCEECGRILVR
jgi:predicted  nucleic acid-binding Zn-ribbon protein